MGDPGGKDGIVEVIPWECDLGESNIKVPTAKEVHVLDLCEGGSGNLSVSGERFEVPTAKKVHALNSCDGSSGN